MSLLVIEGLDGSGKSTQVKMMMDYFKQNAIQFQYIHFPRPECPFYGELISRFLRGEFGDLDQVDPYIVALLYAGDRLDAKKTLEKWIHEGTLVLLDRYVYSNIAFQCAKIKSGESDIMKLKNWILELEFNYNALPKPDLNIFIDVPEDFTRAQLTSSRSGAERDYLQGAIDIHENSLEFQQRVRNIYLNTIKNDQNGVVISCDQHGAMLSPSEINTRILATLKKHKIIG